MILPQQWGELFARCTHFSTAPNLPLSEFCFNWNLGTLQQAFVRLKEELATSKMCLFFNLLDEYDGDYDEIACFLKDVARSPLIKVCVSSRPLVVFEEAFKHSPTLRLQDLTYADIIRYIDERLNNNGRRVLLQQIDAKNAETLKKDLVAMANGIFLWVKLVVTSLLNGLSNHDEILGLYKRLRSLPRWFGSAL